MRASGGDDSGTAARGSVTFRRCRPEDVRAVAALHASQISEGFLSSLGPRFLERLYRRITRHPGSFTVVAEDAGGVAGFVAGSTSTRALFASFLARDGALVVLGSPGRLLGSWRRVLETLRHGGGEPATTRAGAELLAIAVRPDARRRGVAAGLVDALLHECAERGATSVEVTVGADNSPAIALYGSKGFVPARRFELHAGTASITMRHDRPADAGGRP